MALVAGAAVVVTAQQPDASSRTPYERHNDNDVGKNIRETIAKQKAEREKKDFQEMLDRGDQALRISEELEKSFESNKQLTGADVQRLQTLEKLVSKIRSELGGDDDAADATDAEDKPPAALDAAFSYLRDSAVKLVNQLKKSTRFTVSAAAIQTSNNFLRVIRFLRIRK